MPLSTPSAGKLVVSLLATEGMKTKCLSPKQTNQSIMYFIATLDAIPLLQLMVLTVDIYFWIILVWFTLAMLLG